MLSEPERPICFPCPFCPFFIQKKKGKKTYELDFDTLGFFKKTARVPKRVEHYFLVRPMKPSFAANKKGENSGGTCQTL